jgi:hypothetical protein
LDGARFIDAFAIHLARVSEIFAIASNSTHGSSSPFFIDTYLMQKSEDLRESKEIKIVTGKKYREKGTG